MNARDSYRFALDSKTGASICAESVTLPWDSGSPLVRKMDVFPQRRPDRQNLVGQAACNRLSRSMEIIIDWKQPIGLQLAENTSQLLLDPINRVKEIPAVHVEFPAAQLPIGAQEKVIPEHTIFPPC